MEKKAEKTYMDIGMYRIHGTEEELLWMIEDMTKLISEITQEDLDNSAKRSWEKSKNGQV